MLGERLRYAVIVTFFSSNTSPGRSFLCSYQRKCIKMCKTDFSVTWVQCCKRTYDRVIFVKVYLVRNDKTSPASHVLWRDQRTAATGLSGARRQGALPGLRRLLPDNFNLGSLHSLNFTLLRLFWLLYDQRRLVLGATIIYTEFNKLATRSTGGST